MFLVLSSTYHIITHHCVVSLLTGELANIIFIYKTCFAWCTRVLRLIGTSFFAAAIRVDLNAFAVAFEANHAVFFMLELFFRSRVFHLKKEVSAERIRIGGPVWVFKNAITSLLLGVELQNWYLDLSTVRDLSIPHTFVDILE